MVFESREEARQSVREKKFVRIKDQRVTQVLAGKASQFVEVSVLR